MTDERMTGLIIELIGAPTSDQLLDRAMVMIYHKALTLALHELGHNITVRMAIPVDELPVKLDYYIDQFDRPLDSKITFLVKPHDTPTTRVSDAQVMTTAMAGAYYYSMDAGTMATPEHLIKPQAGIVIMAKAHWDTLPKDKQDYHLARAKEYLEQAERQGDWPE